MKKYTSSFILVALLFAFLCNGYIYARHMNRDLRVTEVIDGDTVKLENGDRVRLLGIDAPESGQCYSVEAKNGLSGFVQNIPVRIEEERKDSYGRRMGLVYIGETLVNSKLIELGYGKPDYTKNTKKDLFIAAYNQAKREKRGVNSELCKKAATEAPPNSDCTILGNIDKASGQKFYHFPECPHYKQIVLDLNTDEGYFCSEEEAQAAGFILASECEH